MVRYSLVLGNPGMNTMTYEIIQELRTLHGVQGHKLRRTWSNTVEKLVFNDTELELPRCVRSHVRHYLMCFVR